MGVGMDVGMDVYVGVYVWVFICGCRCVGVDLCVYLWV